MSAGENGKFEPKKPVTGGTGSIHCENT